MFICTECKTKYKTKPDYCDCGNNVFEQTGLTVEQKSEIISRIFFGLCIILSVTVWLIPAKSPQKTQTKPIEKIKLIPDINKIWKDTVKIEPKVEPKTEILPQKEAIKTTLPPQKPLPKPAAKSVQQPPKTKVVEKIIEKPVQPVSKPVVKTEPPKPVYNPNSPAMINYKTKLRAALFSKFAVGSIQGSGNCSISFSIDKSGKLVNRKFTHQSDNKTLNDTVYYMLMRLPYFSTPPTEYNGETIHMNFTINNGDYEISIY